MHDSSVEQVAVVRRQKSRQNQAVLGTDSMQGRKEAVKDSCISGKNSSYTGSPAILVSTEVPYAHALKLSLQHRNAPTLHFNLSKHAQIRDTDCMVLQPLRLTFVTILATLRCNHTQSRLLNVNIYSKKSTVRQLHHCMNITESYTTKIATSLGRYQKADLRKWVLLKDHHCICGSSLREIPLYTT